MLTEMQFEFLKTIFESGCLPDAQDVTIEYEQAAEWVEDFSFIDTSTWLYKLNPAGLEMLNSLMAVAEETN